jgi:hypothetical protein
MNLEDLIKLAGVTKSPYDTPVQEQPTEIEKQPVMDDAEGMRTLIALVTPEQLNQLTGEAPVEEEGYANSGDHYSGEPEEYKGTLGSPADLSLRRYLGANGQPVHVDETKVYEDHKVEDITEAWKSYKAEPVAEVKTELEEAVVDEDDVEEDNAFNTAAANAKKAGKSHFTFNNKKYPVKIDDKTADALTDDIDRIKDLAGVQVDEAPFPGEFDYTNSPQEDEEIKAIMMKHPEEAKKLKATGDIDSGSDLYMDLFSYYLDSGEMPYGTAKARDGDPVEWILDRLDDMGMPMGNLESVEQDKLRNQFTVRTFDESLNDALPYVNALVKEMKAIREADEFTKQTMDSLVATIDKMDSVKLRKGIDVKSDPENPMNFSSFGNMPKENQIATVLEYLGNSIEFSKSQDQLVTLLTRMSDEMERVKDKPMMVKVIGAIKSLMPKLTTTASEGTDIKKVSVENYMERKLSNYEFDKLFG